MSNLVENPYPIFTDTKGEPLEDGFIFIGQPGLNPMTNYLQAYWDSALSIPANNIRTKGGYPSNSGTPGRLYTDTNYSIVVQDRRGSTMYTNLNSLDFSNSLGSGTTVSVDTITDLRAIVPGEANIQASVAGSVTPGDGLMGPLYYWDPDSVEADNGASVIKPTSIVSGGRWLWINTNATTITENISASGILVLDFNNKVFLAGSAVPLVLTIPDGNFQGQVVNIANTGLSTIELSGGGIPSGALVSVGETLTWLGTEWIGATVNTSTVTATTVDAAIINLNTAWHFESYNPEKQQVFAAFSPHMELGKRYLFVGGFVEYDTNFEHWWPYGAELISATTLRVYGNGFYDDITTPFTKKEYDFIAGDTTNLGNNFSGTLIIGMDLSVI